ncbi:MAG: thioredoxin family protein [Bacilli bacterium]|nr:thioredoxin family protein [Bacilli bacterium]
MRDPEFVELRNKFFFGMLVVIIFAIPIMIFLIKTYGSSNVLTKIEKDEDLVILVTANTCDNCDLVKDILKDKDIKFSKLNSSTNKDYSEIMRKLDIENKREEFPILIYVEDGEMIANLFSIDSKEKVEDFIEFHGLNNSK